MVNLFIFLKILEILFVRPLTPDVGFVLTPTLGFKARVGSLIRTLWSCMCYTFPKIHL